MINLGKTLGLTVLAHLALMPVLAFAQQPPPAELELVELADDLYVIHNDLVPGNATALITEEGVILVDDKFEANVDRILELLGTVTDQPVRYVINTHYHGDHSGGNARLQQMGAEVITSENARLKMVEAGQPGRPSITMVEKGYVHLGGKTVELYSYGRSHTDGDVVVLFPEHRVLAAGDMFTYGENVPQLIDYAGGGSARAWSRTLHDALRLDFDTVVPGHGGVTDKEQMRQFRDDTIRLRERTREMIADDASRGEIEQMLRREFNWQDLHINRGLDGLIAELQ